MGIKQSIKEVNKELSKLKKLYNNPYEQKTINPSNQFADKRTKQKD